MRFKDRYAHLHIIWGNAIKVVSSIYLMYFMYLTIKGNVISSSHTYNFCIAFVCLSVLSCFVLRQALAI